MYTRNARAYELGMHDAPIPIEIHKETLIIMKTSLITISEINMIIYSHYI